MSGYQLESVLCSLSQSIVENSTPRMRTRKSGPVEGRPSHSPGGLKGGNQSAGSCSHRCCTEWSDWILFGLKMAFAWDGL